MSDVTILRADRWVDVEAGEVRSPAVLVVDGNQIVGGEPLRAPQPRHRDRPGRRDAAARAHGHGAQHAHRGAGRPRRAARPDARREGLAGVPDAARRGELPHDADGRLHHRAQPGPHGVHRRLPARRRPGQGGRPGLVPRPAHLPGRPRHHPDRRPPRPHHVPGAGARASCPRAWSRASPTACPRCASRCATR